MEKRKIIKISERRYQLLKFREDKNDWNEYGKNKSLKAISDLLNNSHGEYELYIGEGIMYDVGRYKGEQAKWHAKYFSEKGLESKTI
jgi:hypothetical protein